MRILIIFLLSSAFSFGQTANESLSARWRINTNDTVKFKIVPYKPVYFLVANYTTDVNETPTSDNPLNQISEDAGYTDTELKFQLSFKARAVRIPFSEKVKTDIWVAYTQSSRWQLYNETLSRPFRETNYEPEVLLVFPTRYKFLRLDGVFAGVGINHQSNGQSNPESRSWNRVIFQFGWETRNWSFVLKPWWRLQEESVDDNNPGIENYVGRAELLTAYSKNKHDFSLLARHSLRGGSKNRGSLTLNYAYEVADFLQLHAQIFTGYGESLIDYNHNQTTFGIGLSLLQWR